MVAIRTKKFLERIGSICIGLRRSLSSVVLFLFGSRLRDGAMQGGTSGSAKASGEVRTPIRELSIYDPQPKPRQVPIARERTEYEERIAVVRRFACKIMRRSSEIYSTAAAHSSDSVRRVLDVAEVLRMERGFLPRMAAVGLSGVAGLVFAGRGAGRLQRMFYMLTFSSAATVVSWPQQTKESVTTAYRFAKTSLRQPSDIGAAVAMPEESAPVVKAVEDSAPRQERNASKEAEECPAVSESSEAPSSSPEELATDSDYGQSNPADKDMYSTRGWPEEGLPFSPCSQKHFHAMMHL